MQDRINTTDCATCGRLAPVDAPHYCRDERRETLRDVASLIPAHLDR